MHHASLLRTVRFSAEHHYGRADLNVEENRRTFGPGVHAHHHDWALTVTIRGDIDPDTGFLVDLGELDRILREEVVERFHQRDLNEEVAPVRIGTMQPSTEALARWFFERLAPRIPGSAELVAVRLAESEDLAAEYRP